MTITVFIKLCKSQGITILGLQHNKYSAHELVMILVRSYVMLVQSTGSELRHTMLIAYKPAVFSSKYMHRGPCISAPVNKIGCV